jgi:hypothetical protein
MKLKTLTFIGPPFDVVESDCLCEILISEAAKKNHILVLKLNQN